MIINLKLIDLKRTQLTNMFRVAVNIPLEKYYCLTHFSRHCSNAVLLSVFVDTEIPLFVSEFPEIARLMEKLGV